MTFKVVEGDVMELYKAFKASFHVETHGDINLVTWTVGYDSQTMLKNHSHCWAFASNSEKMLKAHHLKAT